MWELLDGVISRRAMVLEFSILIRLEVSPLYPPTGGRPLRAGEGLTMNSGG